MLFTSAFTQKIDSNNMGLKVLIRKPKLLFIKKKKEAKVVIPSKALIRREFNRG